MAETRAFSSTCNLTFITSRRNHFTPHAVEKASSASLPASTPRQRIIKIRLLGIAAGASHLMLFEQHAKCEWAYKFLNLYSREESGHGLNNNSSGQIFKQQKNTKLTLNPGLGFVNHRGSPLFFWKILKIDVS